MTLPAIDSYDTYGGNKIDYSPVEDPATDLSADQGNQARASVAGMTRTAPRLIVAFTTLAGLGTVTYFDGVYGNAFADTPIVVQGIPGVWAMGLPATITDFTGVEQNLNIRRAHGQVESVSDRWSVQCKKTAPNGLEIAIFDDTDTLTDPDGAGDVVVWIY